MPYFLRQLAPAADSPPTAFDPAWGQFIDTVPVMMWLADCSGQVLYVNESWRQFAGLRPGPRFTQQMEELVHPEDRPRLAGAGAARVGGSTAFEFRLRRGGGEYRWVLERIRPWRDARGTLLGYIGSAIDVHEQKRHEQRLSLIALRQTSLACFGRFILEQRDSGTVATEALRLFCEHLRLPAGLLLRPAEEDGPPRVAFARGMDAETAVKLVTVPASGAALHFPEDEGFPLPAEWMAAEGWTYGMAVPVDPLAPARGFFIGVAREEPDPLPSLHYARDLAAIYAVAETRERAERRLREGSDRALQLQKIEAVGLLAGGVAHDFNNLLTAIRCFAELLRDDLEGEAQRSRADDILHAASRASHLVRQLLAFSRHEVVQPEPVDLHTLVDNLRGFIRSLLSEHVRVEFELSDQSCWCQADPKQVEQVLFNLCLNARDAMLVEGVLTVAVGPGPASPEGGSFVRLSVRDTGPGISPEVCGRLFQPFFTTKPRGRGTGLGLAASRAIAREFGGELSYETELGRGTVFHLDLPCIVSPLDRPPLDEEQIAARPAGRSILLVEDDDLVRAVTLLLAESLGHKVVAFGDSREALAWAEAGGLASVDLLMTDIVMAGMSGHVLASRLRALRPTLLVLYMSGYVDDEATRAAIAQPDVVFLAKPFSHAELAARLDTVFGQTPQAQASGVAPPA
jgi:PAS domain S-box-containing protein